MERWLKAALDYVPDWLEFQMRAFERPGCIAAIAHRGALVYEQAFGFADAARAVPLTPRHRFRVASHSKSFTAAGILRLREAKRLRLDDRVGQHVKGLHPAIAGTRLVQLLSHSAGIRRDMPDAGFFNPFLEPSEIEVTGRDRGRIAEAIGGGSYGEAVSLKRNARGKVVAVQVAGNTALPEGKLAKEVGERYEGGRGPRKSKRQR